MINLTFFKNCKIDRVDFKIDIFVVKIDRIDFKIDN